MASMCTASCMGHGPLLKYGWILQILILIALIIIFWWLSKGEKFGYKTNTKEPPLDIIKKRYARGEITKKEFDKLKKDLSE